MKLGIELPRGARLVLDLGESVTPAVVGAGVKAVGARVLVAVSRQAEKAAKIAVNQHKRKAEK